MGTYIIEVDESEIVECWNEQAAKELGYQEYALKKCPEIKVKPYNPSGDLISREALRNYARKVLCADSVTNTSLLKMFDEIIDNAPTVNIKDQIAGAYNEGYMCGSREAEKARPQGEWEIVDAEGGKIWNCVCTECGHDPQEYIGGTEDWWIRKPHLPNFCPNCGVRMINVKGGAE